MKSVNILSWSDSNISGSEWVWNVYLTQRKDGKYSVTARQVTSEPPVNRVGGYLGLKTAEEVADAIVSIVEDAEGCLDGCEVEAVVDAAAEISESLAAPLRKALLERLDVEGSEAGEQEAEYEAAFAPGSIAAHAAGATWTEERWNGAGGMVRIFHQTLRRSAALWYAANYHQKHGKLPTGKHRVVVTYGEPGQAGVDIPMFGRLSLVRTLETDITYPDLQDSSVSDRRAS